jgi:hypothetical protein
MHSLERRPGVHRPQDRFKSDALAIAVAAADTGQVELVQWLFTEPGWCQKALPSQLDAVAARAVYAGSDGIVAWLLGQIDRSLYDRVIKRPPWPPLPKLAFAAAERGKHDVLRRLKSKGSLATPADDLVIAAIIGGLPNTIRVLFELGLAMWTPRCAEVAVVQPDREMLKFVMASMGRTLTEAQCMQLLLIAMHMGHLQHAQYLSFQRKETPTERGRYSADGRVYWSVMPVEAALKMPKLRRKIRDWLEHVQKTVDKTTMVPFDDANDNDVERLFIKPFEPDFIWSFREDIEIDVSPTLRDLRRFVPAPVSRLDMLKGMARRVPGSPDNPPDPPKKRGKGRR